MNVNMIIKLNFFLSKSNNNDIYNKYFLMMTRNMTLELIDF